MCQMLCKALGVEWRRVLLSWSSPVSRVFLSFLFHFVILIPYFPRFYQLPFRTYVPTSTAIYQPAHITAHMMPNPKCFIAVLRCCCLGSFVADHKRGIYV